MAEFFGNIIAAYRDLGLPLRIALIAGLAIATSAGGVAVVVNLPADHFSERRAGRHDGLWRRHPALRWALLVVKNLLGIVVLPLGIVMSLPLVPGPGLVFILLGLSLLNFPGKRAAERALLRRPAVMRVLNRMRARFGKPPFEVEPD